MAKPRDTRKALGTPADTGPRTWVQVSRSAHEAWSQLVLRKPRAAALLHQLVALMQHQNAVIVPQATLAKMLGCTDRTVRNALRDLVEGNWVQVVQIGAASSINAYVVNSRVAWAERREHLHLAIFDAKIIADAADQPASTMDRSKLRRIPTLYPNEQQLPAGEGEPPPSEPPLPGFEADLPSIEGE